MYSPQPSQPLGKKCDLDPVNHDGPFYKTQCLIQGWTNEPCLANERLSCGLFSLDLEVKELQK